MANQVRILSAASEPYEKGERKMPLYHIQDDDRPMWVMARDYSHAVSKWMVAVAQENKMEVKDVEEPRGVQLVCEDNDFITE